MTEHDEERPARRLERIVSRLQRGERPEVSPEDAPEEGAVKAASRLAASREPYPRMDPAFRRRLAGELDPRRGAGPTRRWALAAAAGVLGGAALGAVGDHLVADRLAPARSEPEELLPESHHAGWVDSGVRLQELTEGVPREITVAGLSLFLVRRGDQVRALSGVCTHQPCQLRWDAADGRLACPWGRYQSFSLEGDSSHTEVPPLPRARVRVEEDRVLVYGVS